MGETYLEEIQLKRVWLLNVFSKWFVSMKVPTDQRYVASKTDCKKIPEQIVTVACLYVTLLRMYE